VSHGPNCLSYKFGLPNTLNRVVFSSSPVHASAGSHLCI
jgi:hypothetical protein